MVAPTQPFPSLLLFSPLLTTALGSSVVVVGVWRRKRSRQVYNWKNVKGVKNNKWQNALPYRCAPSPPTSSSAFYPSSTPPSTPSHFSFSLAFLPTFFSHLSSSLILT
mmetsp:Transcript_10979/g.28831  ORF Transcript_10979/g.28831 Transcript_10979/m.28831 type:complete len:108 (-) Transcript_10979:21-344(-)